MLGIHPYGDGFYGDPGFFYFTAGAEDLTGAASITLGESVITRFIGVEDVSGAASITLGEAVVTPASTGTTLTIDPLYVLGDFVTADESGVWSGSIAAHPLGADDADYRALLAYLDGYVTVGNALVVVEAGVMRGGKTHWVEVKDWIDPHRPKGLARRRGW